MRESPPPKSLTPAERRQRLEGLFPVWNAATLSQFFDAMADRYPQRPLILCDDRAYSYRETMQWSRRLASGLIACGVRSGSHVAILLGNFAEFVAVKYQSPPGSLTMFELPGAIVQFAIGALALVCVIT